MTRRPDGLAAKLSALDLPGVFERLLRRIRERGAQVTTGWVFVSYGLSAAFAMALQIVLTHNLSVARLGVLAATLALAAIFEQTVMARGAETALSLFARKNHSDPGPWGALALELMLIDLVWLAVCVAAFLGVVALLAPPAIDRPLLTALALGTLLQFAWGTTKAGQIVFEPVRRQAQLEVVVNIAAFVLPAIGVVVGGVAGYGWGMAALGGFRSLAALGFVWRRLRHTSWPRWSQRQVSGRELRHLGGLALVRSSAAFLSGQLDILLLAASGTATAVAYYGVARRTSTTPSRIFQPIWTLARKAVVTGIHHGGIREARGQITLAALGMLALAMPAFLVVFIWGRPLMGFVFGPDYVNAAVALAILLPSSWFFDVMTGWAKFAAAVAPKKLVTSGAFVGRCLVCWGLWWIWRPTDAAGMAWIVAIANVVTAAVFWLALFNDRWLIGPRSVEPELPVTPLDGPEQS